MSEILNQAGDCCNPCSDSGSTSGPPGPIGPSGSPGTNGTNGISAFTTITSTWVVPAEGATVNLPVVSSAWTTIGAINFIQNAGYYQVTAIPDSTHVTVRNLANVAGSLYVTNAPVGTNQPSGLPMVAGGRQGANGTASSVTLNSISPTTTKGDIIVDAGGGSPSNAVRKGVGSDGKVLTARSTDGTGVAWESIDLSGVSSSLTNKLPIAKGGTNATTAIDALTNLGAIQSFAGLANNLVIATIPAATYVSRTQVGVSGTIVMKNSTGLFVAQGLGVTMDIAGTAGLPLGLDVGALANSTWYYIWAISDGTNTPSAVFSLSSTTPNLSAPGLVNYTYKALLGAIYSNVSSNLIRSIQYGKAVNIEETEVFDDKAGSATFVQENIAAIIPPIAVGYSGTMGVSAEVGAPWGMVITSDSNGLVGRITYNASGGSGTKLNGFFHCTPFSLLISSNPKQINWKTSTTGAQYRITISGYIIQ